MVAEYFMDNKSKRYNFGDKSYTPNHRACQEP